jgi:hypothetical protein
MIIETILGHRHARALLREFLGVPQGVGTVVSFLVAFLVERSGLVVS